MTPLAFNALTPYSLIEGFPFKFDSPVQVFGSAGQALFYVGLVFCGEGAEFVTHSKVAGGKVVYTRFSLFNVFFNVFDGLLLLGVLFIIATVFQGIQQEKVELDDSERNLLV